MESIFNDSSPIVAKRRVIQPLVEKKEEEKPAKKEVAPKAKRSRIPPPPLGMSVRFGVKKPVVEVEIKEEVTPQVVEPTVIYGNVPVEQDKLNTVWEEFANKQENFLKQTLSLAHPVLTDETVIVIQLENSFQHDKINEVTQQLMPYLRSKLQNEHVTLKVEVSAALETTKAFTPKEKLEQLIKGNPALGKLITTFGMEMD